MNTINFSFLEEEDHGFLNAPIGPARSLAEVFASSTPPSPPDWDLSSHDVLAISDTDSEKTDFVAKNEYFKKIKQGTQDENSGDIRVPVAEYYCEELNKHSEDSHIVFSSNRLQNPISGGTCSAMAFNFADKYLEKRSTMTPDEIFDEIGPRFENSTKTFRTHQAVFNTIHKDDRYQSGDFMQDKIKAMLRFYDRTITDSSSMFYLETPSPEDTQKALHEIQLLWDQYPQGVFVIRCILFENNDKGESYGHSTILIREGEKNYFYDPNEGIYELPNDPEALVDILKPMMAKWVIPFGRIYKIQ